jgi:hypothetical protein
LATSSADRFTPCPAQRRVSSSGPRWITSVPSASLLNAALLLAPKMPAMSLGAASTSEFRLNGYCWPMRALNGS